MDKRIADQSKSSVENQHDIPIGNGMGAGKTPPYNAPGKYLFSRAAAAVPSLRLAASPKKASNQT